MTDIEIFEKVYLKILKFLSLKPKSEWEVKSRLEKYLQSFEEVSPEEKNKFSEEILERLKDQRFIGDEIFANEYVRSQSLSSKPRSIYTLKKFLNSKRIPKHIIGEALSLLDSGFESEALEKEIQKRIRSLKETDPRIKRNKLIAYLIGKGYRSDLVISTVDTSLGIK